MDALTERIRLLTRSPFWAIRPESADLLLFQIARPEAFKSVTWEASKPSVVGKGSSKMAVIPIEGVLSKDGPSWYGSTYETIATAAEQAAADPNVKRIVLAVDSPGGEVTGLPEAAAILAQVAKVKPVSAIVEGMSASAAYYLTSQASDITVTPSGEVGSVGVRMMHVDVSKMLDEMGYKVTEMYSGKYKTEGSPYAPLADETKAHWQERLDAIHADFLAAVTAGRGARATEEIKAGRFGEGRMFDAAAAKANGMADTVQSSRDFYRAVAPAPEEADVQQPYGLPRRARLEVERRKV